MQVRRILSVGVALVMLAGCTKTSAYRFGANHEVGQGAEIISSLTAAATERCEKQGYSADIIKVERKACSPEMAERTEVLFRCVDPFTREAVEVPSDAKPRDDAALRKLALELEASKAKTLNQSFREMVELLELGEAASKQERPQTKSVIDAERPIYFHQD